MCERPRAHTMRPLITRENAGRPAGLCGKSPNNGKHLMPLEPRGSKQRVKSQVRACCELNEDEDKVYENMRDV